jgi:hypothetical protein
VTVPKLPDNLDYAIDRALLPSTMEGARYGTPSRVVTSEPVKQNFYFAVDTATRNYYLELVEGSVDNVLDSIELPYVNHIETDVPLAVTRTYTVGGLYEEHSGFVERSFLLRGRSGPSVIDGMRFKKFRNFLEKYAELSATNRNAFVRGRDIRLVLNFPWEGESYYCTLMQFKPSSSISSSRMTVEYGLALKTNGLATRKWTLPGNIKKYLDTPGIDDRHTALDHYCFLASAQEYRDVPPDGAPIYAGARSLYEEALIVNKKTGQYNSTVDHGAYKSLYGQAERASDKAYVAWDNSVEDVRTEERLSGRYATIVGWFWWIMRQAKELHGVLFQRITSDVDPDHITVRGVAPVPSRNNNTPLIVDIAQREDMTAFDVSMRLYGDRSKWAAIVRANDMLDARTKADGTPLSVGDRLLVPSVEGVPGAQALDIYGTDLHLGDDGDLVLSGTTDVACVSGVDNVAQNLARRYRTMRSQNKAYPGYGLPRLVGTVATSDLSGLVMSAVKTQTLSDHRVSGVSQLAVARDGSTVSVTVTATIVSNNTVSRQFDYPGI